MKILVTIAFVLFWSSLAPAQEPLTANAGASRFTVVDVMVDSGTEPLAAYQLELSATNSAVKIVGIEGGEHSAFTKSPYYDPAAIQQERVVLGAFSTAAAAQLPRGAVRVASVHCLVANDAKPTFTAKVTAAATSGGRTILIQINVKERNGR
jgi:hypothetical protein